MSASLIKDTVSSFVNVPPPKKSCCASDLRDLSLSSNGGNPQVITFTTVERKVNHRQNKMTIKKF